ncbi:MAG: Tim44/TimA family putative adaptor protein [Parvibaculaceae bacterium]|nr:Tim44/TimA family putative adaptor protein [Parvibaculaceae bacterium]|tara:strand:- start:3227 stop:3955 length:729 start_codon:yes stop_codon:yes gene_type:complete
MTGSNRFMSSDFSIINLILLVVAVVVFLKLRSVLGRRTGEERPPFDPYAAHEQSQDNDKDNVINLPGSRAPDAPRDAAAEAPSPNIRGVEPGSEIEQQLTELTLADRRFDGDEFLGGAKLAYEMIVTAFAAGDRTTLQPLLAPEVFESFEGAIDAREKRGETIEMSFIGLKSGEFVKALVNGNQSLITVKFVSEQSSSTKNQEGVVIEGDPVTVREVVDVWTFERDITSRDPNWHLVATGGA